MGEEEFVPAADTEAGSAEREVIPARTRTRGKGKFARASKIVFAVCVGALGLFWAICLQAWVAFAFVYSLLLAGGKKLAARLKKTRVSRLPLSAPQRRRTPSRKGLFPP